jgi:hypothetical protein
MDRTTEAIAHFIGQFATIVEEARGREIYEEFLQARLRPEDLPDLPSVDVAFAAPYEFAGFDPSLYYRPVEPEWFMRPHSGDVDFRPPDIPVPHAWPIVDIGNVWPAFPFQFGGFNVILPEVPTLGCVVNYIHQATSLSDQDYFGVGGHGLKLTAMAPDDANLEKMMAMAGELSPVPDTGVAGSADALMDLADQLMVALEDFDPEDTDCVSVTVEKAPTIEGVFVNGEKVEEAPKLEDHFSMKEKLEQAPYVDDGPNLNAHLNEDGSYEIDVCVDVETGGNAVINNAVVQNMWTGATVTAVMGDHIEINAIIQINAWCDSDNVTSAIDGWNRAPDANAIFNVATFERKDVADDDDGVDEDGFPQHWVIKKVEGDLLVVNWLQQITFMKDGDVGVLSSSGVTTSVYAGNNIAYNDTSILETGFAYDLIIIGGALYDLNLIQQLNILCDSDLIGAVAGFGTTGEGAVSTSGNLLWNQAYIMNVGGADRFDTLPDHYKAAAEALAAGGNALNGGILSDPAFAGLGALRVLYVTGDYVNVQYVKQTNIVCDDDQLALAMHETDPYADAEWSVSTGANALVNNAAILDMDSFGSTYVGGNQYSQEILVQAEIISTAPECRMQDPDALVNEAIIFLADDTQAQDGVNDPYVGYLDPDNAHGDALQTLIG